MVSAGEVNEMQTDREIQTLQTYIGIRDGVAPSTDPRARLNALNEFQSSFAQVERETNDLSSRSPNCERFDHLYAAVGTQLVEYYDQLLSPTVWLADNGSNLDLKKNIEGRLYTLKLFETVLFSLAIAGQEGGISMLDPTAQVQCVRANRMQWLTALVQTHQDLKNLHETVFGFRSALDFKTSADIVRHLNNVAARRKKVARVTWALGELVGSILLWVKGVSPLLKRAQVSVDLPALRWAMSVGALVAFSLAFTKLDSEASAHFSFLQPGVSLKGMTLSKWADLMAKGEQVTQSNLNSPQLYYAYLHLIAGLDRQAAYKFLVENQNFLAEMETKYGSVDAALIHLKEERKNETINQRAG